MVLVDGTFGRGGHARVLLERIGETGRVIAIDRDPEAVAAGRALAERDPRLSIRHAGFGSLAEVVGGLGLLGQVDGVLLDLGVSSPQFDTAERGFSFRLDGELDMRMDPGQGESAAEWLSRASHGEIAGVLRRLGEERYAGRIASAILRERARRPIRTTGQLAALIEAARPGHERGRHPATRSFQAIRIYINRELEELEQALARMIEVLAPGGRMAVISFHSLEDRRVKRFIRDQARGDEYPPGLPVRAADIRPWLRPVGRPVRPGEAEVQENPRARSAVLRVAERIL